MQGAGEGPEVELRSRALDHAAVRVDVDHHRTAVGVGHFHVQGEMRFVRSADAFDQDLRLGLLDRGDELVIAQQRRIIGRLAGAHLRVGQPDDFLADHRQRAGDTDDQHEKPDRQRQPAMDQKPEFGAGFLRHD
ncbi:hypothetical protein D3C84_930390 [compost metagenome]